MLYSYTDVLKPCKYNWHVHIRLNSLISLTGKLHKLYQDSRQKRRREGGTGFIYTYLKKIKPKQTKHQNQTKHQKQTKKHPNMYIQPEDENQITWIPLKPLYNLILA